MNPSEKKSTNSNQKNQGRKVKSERPAVAPKKPRHCEHIMTNGEFCRSLALRGRKHCHFHLIHLGRRLRAERRCEMALRASIDSKYIPMDLPLLEDANSVQLALSHVADALMNNSVDTKRAGLVLYALQTATLNLSNGVDFSQHEDAAVAESYDEFEKEFELGDAAPELKLEEAGERKGHPSPATAPRIPAAPVPSSPPKIAANAAWAHDPATVARLMEILPRVQPLKEGKTILRPAKAGPGPAA